MIAVTRQHTADRINAVVNDPSVRPWVANDTSALDLTARVADTNNILLMGEHGGCMFYPLMSGIYEVHTQVTRQGRGEWTQRLTEACAHWMFVRTPCYEIMTRVPHGHIAARAAAVAAGMRFDFTRPQECRFRNHLVDVHIYSYRIQDWVGRAASLVEVGRAFHDLLHQEGAGLGVTDAHPEDDNHNHYVGAVVDMVWHGQVQKAVNFYNRWAQISRREPITLLSVSPPTVKIDHGLCVTLRNNRFEVSRD